MVYAGGKTCPIISIYIIKISDYMLSLVYLIVQVLGGKINKGIQKFIKK